MKTLYWQKIPSANINGTFWEVMLALWRLPSDYMLLCFAQAGISYEYSKVIDIAHLETYFGEPLRKSKKKGDANVTALARPNRPSVVSVLEASRTQSIGVFLPQRMSD